MRLEKGNTSLPLSAIVLNMFADNFVQNSFIPILEFLTDLKKNAVICNDGC